MASSSTSSSSGVHRRHRRRISEVGRLMAEAGPFMSGAPGPDENDLRDHTFQLQSVRDMAHVRSSMNQGRPLTPTVRLVDQIGLQVEERERERELAERLKKRSTPMDEDQSTRLDTYRRRRSPSNFLDLTDYDDDVDLPIAPALPAVPKARPAHVVQYIHAERDPRRNFVEIVQEEDSVDDTDAAASELLSILSSPVQAAPYSPPLASSLRTVQSAPASPAPTSSFRTAQHPVYKAATIQVPAAVPSPHRSPLPLSIKRSPPLRHVVVDDPVPFADKRIAVIDPVPSAVDVSVSSVAPAVVADVSAPSVPAPATVAPAVVVVDDVVMHPVPAPVDDATMQINADMHNHVVDTIIAHACPASSLVSTVAAVSPAPVSPSVVSLTNDIHAVTLDVAHNSDDDEHLLDSDSEDDVPDAKLLNRVVVVSGRDSDIVAINLRKLLADEDTHLDLIKVITAKCPNALQCFFNPPRVHLDVNMIPPQFIGDFLLDLVAGYGACFSRCLADDAHDIVQFRRHDRSRAPPANRLMSCAEFYTNVLVQLQSGKFAKERDLICTFLLAINSKAIEFSDDDDTMEINPNSITVWEIVDILEILDCRLA